MDSFYQTESSWQMLSEQNVFQNAERNIQRMENSEVLTIIKIRTKNLHCK